MIKTIKEHTEAKIVVKKSRFIANVFNVQNEKEAKVIIQEINKKYFDAKHNCYAYRIQEGNIILEKSSDNGEPSGTAGAPILDVIKKQGLCNVLIVVTRYFGGILLGTGGLVKAYTESATRALEKVEICELEKGNKYEIEINYDELNKLKYNCEQLNIKIDGIFFEEHIKVHILSTKEKFADLLENRVWLQNYKIIKEDVTIPKLV